MKTPLLAFTLSIITCLGARAELKWEQTSVDLHPSPTDKQAVGHFKYQNVGKTPVLRPGEVFEYTSGTPLATSSGIMGGTYQMVSESGEHFDIEIPTFSLDTPSSGRRLN